MKAKEPDNRPAKFTYKQPDEEENPTFERSLIDSLFQAIDILESRIEFLEKKLICLKSTKEPYIKPWRVVRIVPAGEKIVIPTISCKEAEDKYFG